jgi:hypothetical protein
VFRKRKGGEGEERGGRREGTRKRKRWLQHVEMEEARGTEEKEGEEKNEREGSYLVAARARQNAL